MNRSSPIIDDLRAAFGRLLHDWHFSLATVFCLTLGIAAVSSILSILYQIMFTPLPFREPDRLVMVRSENQVLSASDVQMSRGDLYDLQTTCKTMNLAGYWLWQLDMPLEHGYRRLHGMFVTKGFLEVLAEKPYLGSNFSAVTPEGTNRQLLLGTHVWRDNCGSRTDVVSNIIRINSWSNWPEVGDQAYHVVGLLPDGLRFLPGRSFVNQQGYTLDRKIDFIWPEPTYGAADRKYRERDVIARLQPGFTVEQANAELKLIAARLAEAFPETNKDWTFRAIPLDEYIYSSARSSLTAALVASLIVLLIACGNAAHLMLIRFNRQKASLAVRAALGATPSRLVRLILFEACLSSIAATGFATVFSGYTISVLSHIAPREFAYTQSGVNLWIILVVSLLAFTSICLLAFMMQRQLRTFALRGMLSISTRTGSAGAGTTRLLRLLAVIQISVAFILLVAAGMLVARQIERAQTDFGFEIDNRLTLSVSLPDAKHEWNYNSTFCHEVMRRTRNIPGVFEVGAALGLPMGSARLDSGVMPEGRPLMRQQDSPPIYMRVVTDEYFTAMGIPLIHGRSFKPYDGGNAPGYFRNVIINESLARHCWPDSNPIGRRLKSFEEGRWLEVVGVVGDIRANGADEDATMELYITEHLAPQSRLGLVVHTEHDPLSIVRSIREEIKATDSDAYISDVRSMRQVIHDSQAQPRYLTTLLTSLAILGLLLAAIGIFLSSAFSVARRKQELRIRAACGATPGSLIRLVMARESTTALIGISVGLLAVTFLQTQFDLDWRTARYFRIIAFLVVPACLLVASLVASFLVAIRSAYAMRSSP